MVVLVLALTFSFSQSSFGGYLADELKDFQGIVCTSRSRPAKGQPATIRTLSLEKTGTQYEEGGETLPFYRLKYVHDKHKPIVKYKTEEYKVRRMLGYSQFVFAGDSPDAKLETRLAARWTVAQGSSLSSPGKHLDVLFEAPGVKFPYWYFFKCTIRGKVPFKRRAYWDFDDHKRVSAYNCKNDKGWEITVRNKEGNKPLRKGSTVDVDFSGYCKVKGLATIVDMAENNPFAAELDYGSYRNLGLNFERHVFATDNKDGDHRDLFGDSDAFFDIAKDCIVQKSESDL